MALPLEPFAEIGLDEALLDVLIEEQRRTNARLERWWSYYRNEMTSRAHRGAGPAGWGAGAPGGGKWYALAQEAGLPARLSGAHREVSQDDRARVRRERVIENDIAWRIHTMVDFMFGKPVRIVSTAEDEAKARLIESLLDAVWEASGGIALLQDMALLGHVFGHVDLLVRVDPGLARAGSDGAAAEDRLLELAGLVRIETVEPRRGIPILDPTDYRRLIGYVIHFERELNEAGPEQAGGTLRRVLANVLGGSGEGGRRRLAAVTEVFSARHRRLFVEDRVMEDQRATLLAGEVPVVHIQNVSQPFHYQGLGEVEPLVPLQDELNTRLSDRANRVTLQSFKMYLAKGIEGFDTIPVGPGQIWSTDNMEAEVVAFGGDTDSPSERAHVEEIREAMDKVSGVPPLAGGVVRAKIGNLSSANALKITLMPVLGKTARKRVTYGGGIARACELILRAFDEAGVLRTEPAERGVRLEWSDPIPEDVREQVLQAKAKAELGVPRERVLEDLGEGSDDAGVT